MQPANLISNGGGAIWLNDVYCNGSESRLLDCNFNNVTLQCDHGDDVGIHCFLNCSTEDEGTLRIVPGYAKHQGRLEIKYRGEWGTVCDNHFGNIDAEVACKQLGYCSGIMQPANLISNGGGAIWLNDVYCNGSESRLLDCNFNNVTLQCDHRDDVGIHCFLNCSTEDEGDLRIAAGYAKHQGRLEIKYRGEWGTVCDNHFGNVDAEVACRQLGYCSGIMQPAKLIRNGHGAVWLNDVNCSGSESKLLDCNFNNMTLQCDHRDDVGIHCFLNCSTEDEGNLRITAGYAKNQGRLEINYRGEWGTVCGNHFGNVDAEVACKQLGYCSGIMQPANLINRGKGAIWLNDVNCSGSESKLLDCNFNNVTIQCEHYWHDVGIHCFLNCSTEDEGSLRIAAGYAKHQGRLEINYRGEWGTVCGHHFGNVDAAVACKQLGYCSGIMQPVNRIRHGKGAIWLNDVNCSGSESKLLDCNFNNVTLQCEHYWHDVGVHCFLNCSTEDEGSLRISAGYAKHQGRLEIKYRGEWGTVCGNRFGNVDAEVACKQLGYCSGIMQPANLIRHGTGAIWLNDVNCSGSESTLLDCNFNNVTLQCEHYWHDVGVHCFLNCSTEDEGSLRIVAGYAKHQGRLEIKYRGEWGTVCGHHFGNVDAEVACKQLGYCSGIMQPANLIRHGKGAIWLNDLNCSGSESRLLDCNFNNVTLQCEHYWHDVGVHCFLSCSTEDEGRLRIAAGYALHQGRLEMKYKGEWGTVCDNQFENIDAEIACRQLGYCSGIMQPRSLIRDGVGPIWLNDVKCSGSESELLHCNFNTDTSTCSHYHDVGIHCFLNCSTEHAGVTPNENIRSLTNGADAVVFVIIGVVVVIIVAVVVILIVLGRRRYCSSRSGIYLEEPDHQDTEQEHEYAYIDQNAINTINIINTSSDYLELNASRGEPTYVISDPNLDTYT
ncbi:deleted in malignant brain tumors 1 protein-like [Mytilus trossulus]|uniref:deleted in malignant brain tumors 1 protein-like n=1 Tax=Mytilus trossulus TaxID=6551 RepID=UPI00300715DC